MALDCIQLNVIYLIDYIEQASQWQEADMHIWLFVKFAYLTSQYLVNWTNDFISTVIKSPHLGDFMFSVLFHVHHRLSKHFCFLSQTICPKPYIRYLRQSNYRSGEMYWMTFPLAWTHEQKILIK